LKAQAISTSKPASPASRGRDEVRAGDGAELRPHEDAGAARRLAFQKGAFGAD
jgi:hypothetical protein